MNLCNHRVNTVTLFLVGMHYLMIYILHKKCPVHKYYRYYFCVGVYTRAQAQQWRCAFLHGVFPVTLLLLFFISVPPACPDAWTQHKNAYLKMDSSFIQTIKYFLPVHSSTHWQHCNLIWNGVTMYLKISIGKCNFTVMSKLLRHNQAGKFHILTSADLTTNN